MLSHLRGREKRSECPCSWTTEPRQIRSEDLCSSQASASRCSGPTRERRGSNKQIWSKHYSTVTVNLHLQDLWRNKVTGVQNDVQV